MPISTTTAAAIIDKIAQVLSGIIPTRRPDLGGFSRAPANTSLVTWARGGSESFRKFEIATNGGRSNPGVIHAEATYVQRPLRLLVAYTPRLLGLAGDDELDGLQDLVEADANLIWQAIWSPGNLIDGCNAMQAQDQGLVNRDDPDVWFLEFEIDVHYYQAHTFT